MDTQRLEELEKKKFEVGLTHEEANELGRLLAERAGRPYGNAESPGHPDLPTAEHEGKPYSEPEVREARGVDPSTEEPDRGRPGGDRPAY
jgi:hypothetical protein